MPLNSFYNMIFKCLAHIYASYFLQPISKYGTFECFPDFFLIKNNRHENPCKDVIPQNHNYFLGIPRRNFITSLGIHIFKALIHSVKLFSKKIILFFTLPTSI